MCCVYFLRFAVHFTIAKAVPKSECIRFIYLVIVYIFSHACCITPESTSTRPKELQTWWPPIRSDHRLGVAICNHVCYYVRWYSEQCAGVILPLQDRSKALLLSAVAPVATPRHGCACALHSKKMMPHPASQSYGQSYSDPSICQLICGIGVCAMSAPQHGLRTTADGLQVFTATAVHAGGLLRNRI